MKYWIMLKWQNFKARFKKNGVQREIPLVEAYVFPSGEKIYTYPAEYYGKISSRFYRSTQEAAKYLETYALTKNEWEAAVMAVKEVCAKGVSSKSAQAMVKGFMDINSSMDFFINKSSGLKSANEYILEMMYCMFYVLEEEKETGYSEIHNARKLMLLNNNLEARDFFLTDLKKHFATLFPGSREDTLTLLLDLKAMEERWRLINMPSKWTA